MATVRMTPGLIVSVSGPVSVSVLSETLLEMVVSADSPTLLPDATVPVVDRAVTPVAVE